MSRWKKKLHERWIVLHFVSRVFSSVSKKKWLAFSQTYALKVYASFCIRSILCLEYIQCRTFRKTKQSWENEPNYSLLFLFCLFIRIHFTPYFSSYENVLRSTFANKVYIYIKADVIGGENRANLHKPNGWHVSSDLRSCYNRLWSNVGFVRSF